MVGSRIACCGSANKEEGILAILTDAGFVLRQPDVPPVSDE
jgi:hypothetical protein